MVCGTYPLHVDINISFTFRLPFPQLIVARRYVLPSQIPHFGLQRQNKPKFQKTRFPGILSKCSRQSLLFCCCCSVDIRYSPVAHSHYIPPNISTVSILPTCFIGTSHKFAIPRSLTLITFRQTFLLSPLSPHALSVQVIHSEPYNRTI